MSFPVKFFYNQSDYRMINKKLVSGNIYQGVLRDNCSLMNPVIRFEDSSVMHYNYCFVEQFRRYYTVVKVESYREGLVDVYLDCDVLMSFRGDIFNMNAIVDKQAEEANGDEYIDDSSLVADNYLFSRIYNYPNGFNDTGTYILITAG